MIDTLTEDLLRLRDAPDYLKSRGITASTPTVYRWASTVGVRGVRLETIAVGKTYYTSRQAIQRFLETLNKERP